MFNSITIRRQNSFDQSNPIDIGYLLECLIYYRHVYVVSDHVILNQLINVFNESNLLSLLQEDVLNIIYLEGRYGISYTTDKSGIQSFSPCHYSGIDHTLSKHLRNIISSRNIPSGKGRRMADKIERFVDPFLHEQNFRTSLQSILANKELTNQIAINYIRAAVPEFNLSDDATFFCENVDERLIVSTDIDFSHINTIYHKRVPPSHSTIDPGLILAYLCDSEEHLFFSARHQSELAIDPVGSSLVKLRLEQLSNKLDLSEHAKIRFSEIIFDEAKSLRETFNSGNIPIDDIVKVALKSTKFKDWLSKQNDDIDILKEYYNSISSNNILERLPIKSLRWAFFQGLGLSIDSIVNNNIGTIVGTAINIADAFLLDKLTQGWKPNQFVDNELTPLFKKNQF